MSRFQRRTSFIDDYWPYILAVITGMVLGAATFFNIGLEIRPNLIEFLLFVLLGGVVYMALTALFMFIFHKSASDIIWYWVVIPAIIVQIFMPKDGLGDVPVEEKDTSPVLEDFYTCSSCGKEYTGQFPYLSPREKYPTEIPHHETVDIGETYYNGSIKGATPVAMFQRVTGNLASRDDTDFYSLTLEVPGNIEFYFSYEGSSNGYTYLWDGTIYGTDGITVLKSGQLSMEKDKEVKYNLSDSDLQPGTYYLKISVASGGNPFMNGYSDTNYRIRFVPKCSEHTSVTQVLTKTPSCTEAGELTGVCNICDEQVSTEPLEPVNHIWSNWKTAEEISFRSPLGQRIRDCALCGEVDTSTVLFHLLDGEPKKETSESQVHSVPCTAEGVSEAACPVCGNIESTEIVVHSYGEWETTRTDCTVEGERSRTCENCGEIQTEVLEPTTHTYGEWEVSQAATCWTEGERIKTCTACGHTEAEVLDRIPHSFGEWENVRTDCTVEGEHSRTCENCGEIQTEVLEPTTHTYGEWEVSQAATCAAEGEHSRSCTVCGHTETETLDRIPHSFGEWEIIRTDCTIEGQRSRTCENCGEVETEVLKPSAHTYGEWEVSRAATCAAEGVHHRNCIVCGHLETETLDCIPHSFGEWETSVEATCAAEGRLERKCTDCGSVETEPVECIPHTLGKPERVSGNLLHIPIVSRRVCIECGYAEVTESGRPWWFMPAVIILGAATGLFLFFLPGIIRRLLKKMVEKQKQKTFLCPYCFKTSKIGEAQIQCVNSRCTASKPFLSGESIRWDRHGLPVSAMCSCGHSSNKVVCPHCHNQLPEGTLTGDDMMISVIGLPGSGKTHFTGVLIHELTERLAADFHWSFEGVGDTREHYKKLYGDYLYKQGSICPEGVSADERDEPLIYTLKLSEKGLLGFGKKIRMFTLVFFNPVNGGMRPFEYTHRLSYFIPKSKGIIFLADPLEFPEVKTRLNKNEVRQASSGSQYRSYEYLNGAAGLIRANNALKASHLIDIPVSLVLSKLDMIEPVIPKGSPILEASPHGKEGAFDLSDRQNVDREVRGLLQTWGAGPLLSAFETNFKKGSCFAVSALGMHNSPDSNGRILPPQPHRIEDPLLWIIMQQNIIKAKKNQKQAHDKS